MRFSEIIGQQAVKQRLVQSAKDGRISHAQLFLGPEGSGNLAMAIAYAQFLVCEQRKENDSCGTCPACVKMNKLVHPDVTFSYPVASKEKISKPRSVDFVAEWRKSINENPYLSYNEWVTNLEIENKQGLISVDEATDIISRLNLKSAEAEFKIVIIWFPERLNLNAANKLLKILEEPLHNTIFLLVSENSEIIPPTIISRTQLVKINRISDDDMKDVLLKKHGVTPDKVRRIVHSANGNYNDALLLLKDDTIDTDYNHLFLEWMRGCLKPNVKKISEITEQFSKSGREVQKYFLRHALHIARECLLINYADRSLVRFEGKELEDMSRFAPFVNQKNAEQFVEEINHAHFHLERNANWKILFTDLSFRMNVVLQVK